MIHRIRKPKGKRFGINNFYPVEWKMEADGNKAGYLVAGNSRARTEKKS
jgi:hypothetical protein